MAADVDILIDVLSEVANAKLRQTDQTMQKVRASALQMAAGMRGVDSAFDAMRGKGELSLATLTQMSALLPLMVTPLGLFAVGLGAVATMAMNSARHVKEAAKAMKEMQDISFTGFVKDMHAELIAAAEASDEAFSDEHRKELQAMAVAQVQLSRATDTYKLRIKELDEQLKAGTISQNEWDDAADKALQTLLKSRQPLAEEIRQRKERVEALKKEREHMEALAALQLDGMSAIADTMSGVMSASDKSSQAFAGGDAVGFMSVFDDISVGAMEAGTQVIELEAQWEQSMANMKAIAWDALAVGAAGAFDVYADAVDQAITLNRFAAEEFGRSARNMLASTLRTIGQRSMVEAAYEFAKAIGALADGNGASAALHAKAGAMHLGVAALAGVAAGGLSVNAGGGGGRSAGADPSGGGGGGRSGNTINVTVIGALDHASRRDLAKQLQDEMEDSDL